MNNILLISIQNEFDLVSIKYLHYYLLKNGYNSSLLNLPKFNPEDGDALKNISEFIRETDPMFIGISLLSLEYYGVCRLTEYLKNHFKSIPVIWGGIHPTISPETCLDYADYVCVGEGEKTILDIANAFKNNESVKAINNLCYKEDGQIKRNKLYPLIENLDEISSGDQIPVHSFIQEANGQIVLIDKKVLRKYNRYKGTVYGVMSSRGCPFSCTYCSNNRISGLYETRKIRKRSVENLIMELEKAIKDNPEIKSFNFYDDCFLAYNEEYLKKFCKLYKEKIDKPLFVRTIPTYITRNKIEHLKDAGLSWISLGLQSGSDRVCKDVFKRKSLKADFLKAAAILKDFKIASLYDVILDNPFENEEDSFETIQTLTEAPKPFYIQMYSLNLYLGTELYELAKKECPEKIEDSLKKDCFMYQHTVINKMTRLSMVLSKKFMNKMVYQYKQNPESIKFRAVLFMVSLLSSIILEPVTYFRLIKLANGGSYFKTLLVIPSYLKEGLMLYLRQFKISKKHESS